jgi:hypothetical protein
MPCLPPVEIVDEGSQPIAVVFDHPERLVAWVAEKASDTLAADLPE